ncbi:hypothetical protein F2Q70_00038242 [Brassica cretica]|uniref:Exocyst subunit Exo70 family protein n=1 Tax=Brassica cretica TaxID=69181 RepID=A0A8S9K941_BRACR|nr:hypothetical protein F2Q70_00038242 [Brassica cretica]
MNYLKEACEYKDTLDQVFQHYEKAETDETEPVPERNQRENDEEYKTSAFARQMIRVMELLDSNLEIKSALYRDPSLRSIFLMNNGRYILQKIKGSTEIRDLMGQAWTRKRSTELRQYHKSYQRETWGKVLQCMNQEGLQVNGKISKTALKERFKIFNKTFIPRKARDNNEWTQKGWKNSLCIMREAPWLRIETSPSAQVETHTYGGQRRRQSLSSITILRSMP